MKNNLTVIETLLKTAVIIRTVTMYYTGRIIGYDDEFVVLEECAWISATGRWSEALRTGELDEVEPYPGRCFVARGAIVEVVPWTHELPRSAK